MVSGQPVVAKKKKIFFGKSLSHIKRNILSHRASLYLAPRVRMRRASEWQTKFSVSPGPGLWSLVLGPFGPDLGPGPGPELDNI